jgi:hypothetical protein
MKSILITITEGPNGRLCVRTNDDAPTVGRALTAAQALSVDLLRTCRSRVQEVRFADQEMPALRLAKRLLDPEDLGYTVGPIARDDAREVLGIARIESKV